VDLLLQTSEVYLPLPPPNVLHYLRSFLPGHVSLLHPPVALSFPRTQTQREGELAKACVMREVKLLQRADH
jgi:hypothetical protein